MGVSTTEMESVLMLKGKLSREPNTEASGGDSGGADAKRRSVVPLLRVVRLRKPLSPAERPVVWKSVVMITEPSERDQSNRAGHGSLGR